jgi:uncharacterized membrane protein YfcA
MSSSNDLKHAAGKPLLAYPYSLRARTDTFVTIILAILTCACLIVAHKNHESSVTILIVVTAASILSSVAGFAFSAICGAILFHLTRDTVVIVQLMILCSIFNQIYMLVVIRYSIDWSEVILLLVGGFAGLPFGEWLLLGASRKSFMVGVGLILVVYGSYMLFRRPFVIKGKFISYDVMAGFLGGITGGAMGFPGGPVTIWCGLRGYSKERQRGIFQPYILIMQVVTLFSIPLVKGGSVGLYVPLADFLYVPGALLGATVGLYFFKRLSDLQFAKALNVLLVFSGLTYIL